MSGTGFDLSTSVFSQDGRIFQLEYAQKVIDNADTIIGVHCKDGIILASEKMMKSRLLAADSNRRIFNIDTHIGAVICGHIPDGKNVVKRARSEAENYRDNYGVAITGKVLADRVALYLHAHTLYSSYRPLGVAIFISSVDNGVYSLFRVDCSGEVFKYFGTTAGKGKQVTSTEIEGGNFVDLTCEEALPKVAKMIGLAHKDSREKRFEFEASWICDATNGLHRVIPFNRRVAEEKKADEEIEREMMEE